MHFDASERHRWVMEWRWHVSCRGVPGATVLASDPILPALPTSARIFLQSRGFTSPQILSQHQISGFVLPLHREKDV